MAGETADNFYENQFEQLDGNKEDPELEKLRLQKEILKLKLELEREKSGKDTGVEKQEEKYSYQINNAIAIIKETHVEGQRVKIGGMSFDAPKLKGKEVRYNLDRYSESIMGNGQIKLSFEKGRGSEIIELKYKIIGNNLIVFRDIDNDGNLDENRYSSERRNSLSFSLPIIPEDTYRKGSVYEGFRKVKLDLSKVMDSTNVKQLIVELIIRNK